MHLKPSAVRSMPASKASPGPSKVGDSAKCTSSTSPTCKYWRTVSAPPPMRLDVLVNNAGITGFESHSAQQDPEHASLDGWRCVHRTNLEGVFLGCREAIRAMRPTRAGSIINISSRSGLVGIPAAAAYASSKAAVRNHTKSGAHCIAPNMACRYESKLSSTAVLVRVAGPVGESAAPAGRRSHLG